MNKTQTKKSKLISYWLRHKPEDGNIQLDPYGWATIEEILEALHANALESTTKELIQLSKSFDKVRWKIDLENNTMKATHGHSIAIQQELQPLIPPDILYHGTATRFLESILKNGLLSQKRQYVHLSESEDMAREVASRHGKPYIITINVKELVKKNWKFYKTEENVWLTSDIPSQYLKPFLT